MTPTPRSWAELCERFDEPVALHFDDAVRTRELDPDAPIGRSAINDGAGDGGRIDVAVPIFVVDPVDEARTGEVGVHERDDV